MKNLGEPMHRERVTLKEKVLQRIVESAVEAVKPSSLFNAQFQVTGNNLTAFGDEFDLSRYANVKCIAIGKCAEAMAYEVEKKLGYDVTGIIATPVERHFDTRKFTFFKNGPSASRRRKCESREGSRKLRFLCERMRFIDLFDFRRRQRICFRSR